MKNITVSLTVDDQHDETHARRIINADSAYAAIYEIMNNVFRPARKHGYQEHDIQSLMAKLGDDGEELVHLLERKACACLIDYGIDLDRDYQ